MKLYNVQSVHFNTHPKMFACLSVCSFSHLSVCLYVSLSVCLFIFYMSACLYVSLSACLFVFPQCLSFCLLFSFCYIRSQCNTHFKAFGPHLLPGNVFGQELLLLKLVFAVARLAQVVDVLLQLVEKHLSPLDAAFHLGGEHLKLKSGLHRITLTCVFVTVSHFLPPLHCQAILFVSLTY